MNSKNPSEVAAFFRQHDSVMVDLTDFFAARNISPIDGETIMMLICGVSAGLRQAPITGDYVEPIAIGWTLAAHLGGDA